MFKPYVKEVNSNYFLIGGLGSGVPGDGTESKALKKQYFDDMNNSLDYMFDTGSTKEWIAKKHDYIQSNLSVFIEAPRTAEEIYKILQMSEKINNKLRSLHMYSYKFEVITYDLPKDFNIRNYFDEVKGDFRTLVSWWGWKGIQKYAWGYLQIKSCTKINSFEKACNTQYGDENLERREKIVDGNTSADRVHDINDILNNFRVLSFGKPSIDGWGEDNWFGISRDYTPLKNSKYYTKLESLIKKGKK